MLFFAAVTHLDTLGHTTDTLPLPYSRKGFGRLHTDTLSFNFCRIYIYIYIYIYNLNTFYMECSVLVCIYPLQTPVCQRLYGDTLNDF